ncbi:hypothetical protein BGZ82_010604 [Podila clonocystis]|nr:hypothetical protein BGZ82_010604 [Podila clonocystis]
MGQLAGLEKLVEQDDLDFRELLVLVAMHFEGKEAMPPSLVCHSWNDAFTPMIWKQYLIKKKTLTNERTLQGLVQNASHVQSLFYDDLAFLSRLPLPACTNLTGIYINNNRLSSDIDLAANWDRLTHLIQLQHRLRTVYIEGSGKLATTAFWSSLTSCTHLHLHSLSLTAEHVRALWNACKNLQELDTNNISLINTKYFYSEAKGLYPHLKRLEFRTVYGEPPNEAIQFLTKCPHLTEFSLACTWHWPQDIVPPFIHVLEQGYLPQLDSLTLTDWVEDRELAACLSAMAATTTRARYLDFKKTHFGPLAFSAIVPHFATLETLQWTKCAQVTGAMIQTVLESCPRLRVFSATTIQASLIQKGRPWVCLRLRTLVLCVMVEGRAEVEVEVKALWEEKEEVVVEEEEVPCEQSRAVFGQLARMTALKDLTIGLQDRPIHQAPPVQGLDLRLRSGLDLLRDLKELRRLNYRGTVPGMGSEDIAWMKANFGKCEILGW